MKEPQIYEEIESTIRRTFPLNRKRVLTMHLLAIVWMLALAPFVCGCAHIEPSGRDTFRIIELSEFYDVESAIIPKTYNIFMDGPDSARVDLSIDQINEAEDIFRSDLAHHLRRMLDTKRWELPMRNLQSTATTDTLAFIDDNTKEVLKEFRKYHRQYSGRLDKNGRLIVKMRMFKIDDSASRHVFREWKDDLIDGADGIYGDHFTIYSIDLARKVIVD